MNNHRTTQSLARPCEGCWDVADNDADDVLVDEGEPVALGEDACEYRYPVCPAAWEYPAGWEYAR